MARPLRPDVPGTWHHVINRGADRQDIFSTASDYVRFEHLLAKAAEAFDIEVHAYSFLSNHYHLLLHCPKGNLSAFMKTLQAEYASTYNHLYARSGALFEGRFTSIECATVEQRHLVGRYIHRNPLDLVPANALAAYRWSSLPVYLGTRPQPAWLRISELDAQFGATHDYLDYVVTRQPSDAQAERLRPRFPSPLLDEFAQLVADRCEVSIESLDHTKRGSLNEPRLLAVTLAFELRLADSAAIADRFGFGDVSSVRSTARRGRVRLETDSRFARLRAEILGPMAA